MILCDKFFYKHCEGIFDNKNKFHKHFRSRECQKLTLFFIIKSIAIHKFDLTSFFIFKTIFNDANIVFKKMRIKYFTHITITFIFAAKSITFHKFNLSTFISAENIILKILLLISLLIYRAISSLLFIYKFYKKSYFTIAIFYMRYVSLSKTQTRNKITRFIIFI